MKPQFREGGAKAGRHNLRTKEESLHLKEIEGRFKARRQVTVAQGLMTARDHMGQEALVQKALRSRLEEGRF